jgi:hypothetical protein
MNLRMMTTTRIPFAALFAAALFGAAGPIAAATPGDVPQSSAVGTPRTMETDAADGAHPVSASGTDPGRTWTTVPGESLASLARALYPADGRARQRFIRATAAANPLEFPDTGSYERTLEGGTPIVVPDLRRLAVDAAPTRRADTLMAGRRPQLESKRSPPRAPSGTAAPQPSGHTASSAAVPPASRHPSGADHGEHERALVTALERSVNTEESLRARIQALETLQAELQVRARQLGYPLRPGSEAPAVIKVAAELPAARPVLAVDRTTIATPPSPRAHEGGSAWPLAAGTLSAFALAFALWQRRRSKPAALPASEPTMAAETTLSPSIALASMQTRTSVAHSRQSSLQTLARIEVDDETVDEHAAAIELAEIMMGFGRVQGAADTLADFIHNHPKQAVTPWLKLLEVYRAAGMRSEFEALILRLNQTFNVKAVAWEDFELSRKNPVSLEALPHVMAQISARWGTRDCQRYLQSLLRDNREGTREGFPLPVIDDILLLAGLLDLQLGPLPPAAA